MVIAIFGHLRRRFGRIIESPATTHWLVLVICLGALGLAVVLDPAPPKGDLVRIAGIPVPPLCGLKASTGLSCPGCGLTRSWVSAMHGRLSDSIAFHHLGWLTMLYAALQAGRHGYWLAKPAHRPRVERFGRYLDRGIIFIAGLLLIRWIILFPKLLG